MTSELQSDAVLVENNIERNSYDKVSNHRHNSDINHAKPRFLLPGRHPFTRMRADAAKGAAQDSI